MHPTALILTIIYKYIIISVQLYLYINYIMFCRGAFIIIYKLLEYIILCNMCIKHFIFVNILEYNNIPTDNCKILI